MQTTIQTPKQALNPAYLKQKPDREEIELFKREFISLLDKINEKESEEFHKNLIKDFLNAVYYKDKFYINTKDRTDLVVHNEHSPASPVGVLIETKKPTNKTEMVSKNNLNAKAFQELLLYYFRERKTGKNFQIRYLIITNIYEWFVFDAQDFEKHFYENKTLRKHFEEFENKTLAGKNNDLFYKEIAAPEIEKVKSDIPYTYFNIKDYNNILRNKDKEDDKKLIALYKFLSPTHLLKLPFANDYNQLNKEFYAELLHILGLEEIKEGTQKFIVRKKGNNRDTGSMIENAIEMIDSMDMLTDLKNPSRYGNTKEERLFNVALDLSITWINRILFLKLLESQIVKYHKGNKDFSFLSIDKLEGYDDLNSLFFQILARKEEERKGDIKTKFAHVPYLNSSLFERTDLEAATIVISNLADNLPVKLYSKSVLKNKKDNHIDSALRPLEYLLRFLDAYDFSSEGSEDIQEEDKPLISASVLGLIFEKINGYKDGSFFTPSFITMFMCRDTIVRTVLQKFNEVNNWNCQTITDLHNKIDDLKDANRIFNTIRICDMAVGSGHFLVSALNELIALKAELGILIDKEGKRLKDYRINIENDELIVTDNEYSIFRYLPHNHESQRIQETLFNEKQTIIENCLFGVDINPNSVKICQLRLWIELLKHTYYKPGTNELETLPNIDINIKCGNSLVSRFTLDEDLRPALRAVGYTIADYKEAVNKYRNAHNKEEKRELDNLISEIKNSLKTEISRNDKNVKNLLKYQKELSTLTAPSLFELSSKEKKSLQKKIDEAKKMVEKYKAIIEEIKNNKIYQNALEWRFEFPEVLNDEGDFIGFDAIIGNPPYMRIQAIRDNDPSLADIYEKLYKSATGSYDIYALFTEKAISLIKENNIVNFIMPVKWTNAAFGKGLRSVIMKNHMASKIINFGSFQVFEASTYTGLQWFQKGSEYLHYLELDEQLNENKDLNKYLNSINDGFHKIAASSLTEDAWVLSNGEIMSILNKLNKQPRRLSDIFDKIFQGLATSKDDVYFLYDCVYDNEYVSGYSKQISKTIKIEQGLVKPLLKGEDVHRYEEIKTNRSVIFPYNIENQEATLYTEDEIKDKFPLGYEYLKQCEAILRGREKGRFNLDGEWFQYGRKQGITSAEKEKLVAPEISKGGNFSYDKKGEFYSTTTIYGYIKKPSVNEDYRCLMAILNSQLFWWFLINTGTVLANNYFRFKPNYLKLFPFPTTISENVESQLVELVEKILFLKQNNSLPDCSTLENEINQIVYSLYDLSTEDIMLIESNKIS